MSKNYLFEVSRTKSCVMEISIKIIPVLYDGKKARVRLSGRFQVKEFGDLSLVVQIDDDNKII